MKIHAHILSWNEEKILPFTLDYYSNICEKIFIYDNMSTDSSDEIYKKYPKVEVVKWSSGDEIHELNYTKIKSEEYKNRSMYFRRVWIFLLLASSPQVIAIFLQYCQSFANFKKQNNEG